MSTPEFQRVGGGHAAQFAVGQRPFERAAVLGEIAGPIGRDLLREFRSDLRQSGPGAQRGQLGAPARPHERQRAGALGDQVGHHPRRLGAGGASYRGAVLADEVVDQRGFPQRDRPGALR